jgi:putative membrane protein
MTKMFFYDHNLSAWGWIGMSVGMVAVWGLVITGVVLLMRSLNGAKPSEQAPPRTAEQLLAERFARGEIDTAEYHDRLNALHGTVRS